jgi:hypothetical protein
MAGFKLTRTVEQYQWVETQSTSETKNKVAAHLCPALGPAPEMRVFGACWKVNGNPTPRVHSVVLILCGTTGRWRYNQNDNIFIFARVSICTSPGHSQNKCCRRKAKHIRK